MQQPTSTSHCWLPVLPAQASTTTAKRVPVSVSISVQMKEVGMRGIEKLIEEALFHLADATEHARQTGQSCC